MQDISELTRYYGNFLIYQSLVFCTYTTTKNETTKYISYFPIVDLYKSNQW